MPLNLAYYNVLISQSNEIDWYKCHQYARIDLLYISKLHSKQMEA